MLEFIQHFQLFIQFFFNLFVNIGLIPFQQLSVDNGNVFCWAIWYCMLLLDQIFTYAVVELHDRHTDGAYVFKQKEQKVSVPAHTDLQIWNLHAGQL